MKAKASDGRTVTVKKPLGVLLGEGWDGDVYVEELAPDGNAAEAGLEVGERIHMVSATFGNDLWPVVGAGLNKVMYLIK